MSAWTEAAVIVEQLLADCEAIVEGRPIELDEVPALPALDEQPDPDEVARVQAALARIDVVKKRIDDARLTIVSELDHGQRLRSAARAYRSHDGPATS